MPPVKSLWLPRIVLAAGLGILCLALTLLFLRRPSPSSSFTVADRLRQFGPTVNKRLAPDFATAGVNYPPSRITLIGLKQERQLELWAGNAKGPMRKIKTYPILAASGEPGPKLREGDRQVPEGVYTIEWLNPNSRFHLSMRVNYPNADDLRRAKEEKRDAGQLGGDIMIHGGAASIGCLAVGDPASEELFVLVARSGVKNTSVLLSPWDFRSGASGELPDTSPEWTGELHDQVREALGRYVQR